MVMGKFKGYGYGYRRWHSILWLVTLLLLSLVTGWGMAQAMESHPPVPQIAQGLTPIEGPSRSIEITPSPPIGTVDPIPKEHRLGQQLYLESCSGCHLAVPPAVLPTETWRQLLQDDEHFGLKIQVPIDPQRLLIWNYLQTFSRPHQLEEQVPYRVDESRVFRALHPQVKLPRPTRLGDCASCHLKVEDFNFRSLKPDWQNGT